METLALPSFWSPGGNFEEICYTRLINCEMRRQGVPSTPLFPLPAGLEITSVSDTPVQPHSDNVGEFL